MRLPATECAVRSFGSAPAPSPANRKCPSGKTLIGARSAPRIRPRGHDARNPVGYRALHAGNKPLPEPPRETSRHRSRHRARPVVRRGPLDSTQNSMHRLPNLGNAAAQWVWFIRWRSGRLPGPLRHLQAKPKSSARQSSTSKTATWGQRAILGAVTGLFWLNAVNPRRGSMCSHLPLHYLTGTVFTYNG